MRQFIKLMSISAILGIAYLSAPEMTTHAKYINKSTIPTELQGNWSQTNIQKTKDGKEVPKYLFQANNNAAYNYNTQGINIFSKQGQNGQKLNISKHSFKGMNIPESLRKDYKGFNQYYVLNKNNKKAIVGSGIWFTAKNKHNGKNTLLNVNNNTLFTYTSAKMSGISVNNFNQATTHLKQSYNAILQQNLKFKYISGSQQEGYYKFSQDAPNAPENTVKVSDNIKTYDDAANYAKQQMINQFNQDTSYEPTSKNSSNQPFYKVKMVSDSAKRQGQNATQGIFEVLFNGQIQQESNSSQSNSNQ